MPSPIFIFGVRGCAPLWVAGKGERGWKSKAPRSGALHTDPTAQRSRRAGACAMPLRSIQYRNVDSACTIIKATKAPAPLAALKEGKNP